MMFNEAAGTLCLRWEAGYGEARAAAERGVLCSWGGVGGKATKGEVLPLLSETSLRFWGWFAFALFPNSSWSKEKERPACRAVSLLVRYLCKGYGYRPKGISSLPSCLCTWKHGNATQRAAGPA